MKSVRPADSESTKFDAQKPQKGLFDQSTTRLQGIQEQLLVFEKVGLINVSSEELLPRDLQELAKTLRAQLGNPTSLLQQLQLGPKALKVSERQRQWRFFVGLPAIEPWLIDQWWFPAIFYERVQTLLTSHFWNRRSREQSIATLVFVSN
jgi:hypothetical protein